MTTWKMGLAAMATAVLGTTSAWAGDSALRLNRGADILKEWKQDQHVYVKGQIGVSDARLSELEQWIDANASNWTVLLVQSASGESYRDASGRTHRSIDAIEHAMGMGLPATTGFGALKHPETNQANGTFFILFLQERNFSYYGSEAYERRGLGARQWAGNLDASAKRAMRNGGRIVEAAKGTITDIDQRLANALAQEQRRAEEARQAAERRKVEARLNAERRQVELGRAINAGENELTTLEQVLTTFGQDSQVAGGDLANTDTGKWTADLQNARDALDAGQLNMADTVTKEARKGISETATSIRRHEDDRARIRSLTTQLDGFQTHPFNQSGPATRHDLQEHLEGVRAEHAAGNTEYRNGLAKVERQWQRLTSANRAAAEAEQRQLAWEARRKTVRRNTIIGCSGGAGGLILIGGLIGNRLRRKRKIQAESLLAQRRHELKKVSDRLLALMDRSSLILGSEVDLPRRGYEGETLAASKQGIAAVDNAFVISSHIQDLIAKATALVEPGNPFSATRNFVNAGRYQQAIGLLDDEVVCRPASPPPLPATNGEPGPARPGLAEGDDFALELPEWTERLEQAMEAGRRAIDLVDTAWATIVDRREALQRAIDRIKAREDAVTTPASDGWLGLSGLFSSWLPLIGKLLEEGTDTSRADPVAALRRPITLGDRMAQEAEALADLVLAFRETRWKAMEDHEARLTRCDRATHWLDQRLDALTASAEDITQAGMDAPVHEQIAHFGHDLQHLAERVAKAAEEAERANTESLQELEAATREVASARDHLARQLKVSADTVLVETPERDPSVHLQEGRAQRLAALAALDIGGADTAGEFLDEVDRLVAEARALVQATKDALQSYDRERRELVTNRDTWKRHAELTRQLVTSLRAKYAPAALLIDVDAGQGPSFADAPQHLDTALASVAGLLDQAEAGKTNARLLEAREMMQAGIRLVADGEELCTEVEARRDSLVDLESNNTAHLHETSRTCDDLKPQLDDRRVMRATVNLFAKASARLDEARTAVEAAGHLNNPYRTASLLEELRERLTVIRGEVANDLRLHQHATELLEQVQLAEQEARTLSGRAQDDGIPDSPQTTEKLASVRQISRSLAGVEGLMKENHGDWRSVSDELGSIHSALRKAALTLRNELRFAQEAVATIKQAEDTVRRASRWSGRYGVSIAGSPGSQAIVEANRAILAGDYHHCMRHAGFAVTQARQAIAQAEAEVAAIRRRREAAAAARRAAARRSRMSATNSLSSSRSSSFGSSSSVGRSSFSSSSGVGRSGW